MARLEKWVLVAEICFKPLSYKVGTYCLYLKKLAFFDLIRHCYLHYEWFTLPLRKITSWQKLLTLASYLSLLSPEITISSSPCGTNSRINVRASLKPGFHRGDHICRLGKQNLIASDSMPKVCHQSLPTNCAYSKLNSSIAIYKISFFSSLVYYFVIISNRFISY